jgi:hypothetical protein
VDVETALYRQKLIHQLDRTKSKLQPHAGVFIFQLTETLYTSWSIAMLISMAGWGDKLVVIGGLEPPTPAL